MTHKRLYSLNKPRNVNYLSRYICILSVSLFQILDYK